MTNIQSAKVLWYGVLINLQDNNLTIPAHTVDTTCKSDNDIPATGSVHENLLNQINSNLPSLLKLKGVAVQTGIATPTIKVDISSLVVDVDDGSNNRDDVYNAINDKVTDYAQCVHLDESNRVTNISINPLAKPFLEFQGVLTFDVEGNNVFTLSAIKLTKLDDTTVTWTKP